MLIQDTNGRLPAVHISEETIRIAQRMQMFIDAIAEGEHDGNGEIVFKLKVAGGKVCRVLDFIGKWLPRNNKKK